MLMVISWNGIANDPVSIWETVSPSPFASSNFAPDQLQSESHFMNLSPKP